MLRKCNTFLIVSLLSFPFPALPIDFSDRSAKGLLRGLLSQTPISPLTGLDAPLLHTHIICWLLSLPENIQDQIVLTLYL